MARLLRFSSGRFERRTTDYFYPEVRAERPRITERELPLSVLVDTAPAEGAYGESAGVATGDAEVRR